MHYFKKDGTEFIENGLSLLRVESMAVVGDIYNPGRFGRIFLVKEVKRANPRNLIFPGSQICLSFPPDKMNSKEHTWSADEPKQIPLKMRKFSKPTATEEVAEKV